MKENKQFLLDLLKTSSPSGDEKRVVEEVFNPYMSGFSKHEATDYMYNSVFSVHDPKHSVNKKVLISGHIDSIGLMISNITETGLLNVISNGGMDRRVLPGSLVDIIKDDGSLITGVIGKRPIHVENDKEYDQVTKIEDLTIDLGLSKDEVLALGIHPGSLAVFKRGNENIEFGNGKLICASDLDDKIGVYITAEVLKNLQDIQNPLVYGAAFTQEEVGLRGAGVMSGNLDPDISIDIDVTFETKDSDIDPGAYGEVELGKGPVLEYGPDKNRELNNIIQGIAKTHNIPLQIVASRCGGTNTNAIQKSCRNCMTTHIAIPLKNMHTPVEIVSWDDVENCIKLIVEYIRTL